MSFPDGTIANASNLELDYNGDGTVDTEIAPVVGEEVHIPEPTVDGLISLLKEYVAGMEVSRMVRRQLETYIIIFEKQIAILAAFTEKFSEAHGKLGERFRMQHGLREDLIERIDTQSQRQLQRAAQLLVQQIEQLRKRGKVRDEDAVQMIQLIDQIEMKI